MPLSDEERRIVDDAVRRRAPRRPRAMLFGAIGLFLASFVLTAVATHAVGELGGVLFGLAAMVASGLLVFHASRVAKMKLEEREQVTVAVTKKVLEARQAGSAPGQLSAAASDGALSETARSGALSKTRD